jgi:cation diffusion facilitator family transporter
VEAASVALLADTILNFADAATAIPLGFAFLFARKRPSTRFSFGYGRIEDLAGLAVLLTILASAIVAGIETIDRFFHPQPVTHLWAVALASIIGFLGNEGVAIFRIKLAGRSPARRWWQTDIMPASMAGQALPSWSEPRECGSASRLPIH